MELSTRHSLRHRVRNAGLPIMAIIRRELLTVLRLRRTFWLAAALVAVLTWSAIDSWPSGFMSWANRGTRARSFLVGNSWWLLAVGALTIPAFAATSIVNERERNTLGMLWSTGIGPLTLLLGKFGASVAYYVLTVFVALPCIAVLYFLVGVDLWSLAAVAVLLVVTAGTMAAAGLWVSSRARTSMGALALGYFLMLFTQGILWVVLYLFGMLIGATSIYAIIPEELAVTLLPMVAIPVTVAQQGGGPIPFLALAYSAGYQLFLMGAFMYLAYRSIRSRLFQEMPAARVAVSVPTPYMDPAWAQEASEKPVGQSYRAMGLGTSAWEIARGEMRRNRIRDGHPPWLLLGFMLLFVVLPTIVLLTFRSEGAQALVFAYDLAGIIAAVLAPPYVIGYRLREKQAGMEDSLRMTLLRPEAIFWGKFFGGGLRLSKVLAVVIGIQSILWLMPNDLGQELYIHIYGLSLVVMCAAISLSVAALVGTYSKRIGSAIATTYIALLVLLLFIPVLLYDLDFLRRGEPLEMHWRDAISPFAAFLKQVEITRRRIYPVRDWMPVVAGHLTFAAVLAFIAYRRFVTLWRRGEK